MRLYLDDLRETPLSVWYDESVSYTHSPTTAAAAIELLATGQVEFISFDHDLGPPDAGTGYDVAQWIEEQAHTNPDFRVPNWSIHSANPVGARNIDRAMRAAAAASARRGQL